MVAGLSVMRYRGSVALLTTIRRQRYLPTFIRHHNDDDSLFYVSPCRVPSLVALGQREEDDFQRKARGLSSLVSGSRRWRDVVGSCIGNAWLVPTNALSVFVAVMPWLPVLLLWLDPANDEKPVSIHDVQSYIVYIC